MNRIYITLLMLSNSFLFAQIGNVGINTTTPDASAVLDVNSVNKGLLIPRVPLQSGTDITTIPAPAKGLIIYNTNAALSNGEGFYVNYGTPSSAQWYTFAPYTNTNYILDNTYSTTATSSIKQIIPVSPASTIVDNVDLGLSLAVTIPAFSATLVIVTYSTPVGFQNSGSFLGYMGVRFLKNGTEAPGGSRKYTVSQVTNVYSMVTVGTTYVETITNSSSTPMTITYSLNGYIEKAMGGASETFIFNMFSSSGVNFNWGKGTMSAQVFRKSL
ncbi:hypothetical protein [Chryseobacterium sediminis]|uniref:hypothetical protein n=1 Tax=Chryseobacterium sediminis TaxID=1679494 RepID=UPI00285FFE92|nr:hypothetical protein [Chryseobacterium sediminis]MDR6465343.1 hypothetical protein [Chryseobacterium sediminis]